MEKRGFNSNGGIFLTGIEDNDFSRAIPIVYAVMPGMNHLHITTSA